jgi:hypothetical protein
VHRPGRSPCRKWAKRALAGTILVTANGRALPVRWQILTLAVLVTVTVSVFVTVFVTVVVTVTVGGGCVVAVVWVWATTSLLPRAMLASAKPAAARTRTPASHAIGRTRTSFQMVEPTTADRLASTGPLKTARGAKFTVL